MNQTLSCLQYVLDVSAHTYITITLSLIVHELYAVYENVYN